MRIHGLDKVPVHTHDAAARSGARRADARAAPNRASCAARLPRAVSTRRFRYSFIARAHATLFGGGDDARQIENPIAADLDALRPSVLPSLLAAAARNQRAASATRCCSRSARSSKAACRARRPLSPPAFARAQPRASWTKATHAADAFDAKADMLAVLEAAMGGAHERAGQIRRARLVSPRPFGNVGARAQDPGHVRRTAPENSRGVRSQRPVQRVRSESRCDSANPRRRARRARFSRLRPIRRSNATLPSLSMPTVGAEDVLRAARAQTATSSNRVSMFRCL